MNAIHVTGHATERFQERVANVPDADARAALSCAAVRTAAAFGAPFVRLGTGQRVVLDGSRVVTVLPIDTHRGTLDARRDHLHGRRG